MSFPFLPLDGDYVAPADEDSPVIPTDIPGEIWKQIGDGGYWASSEGRIIGAHGRLKQFNHYVGYKLVSARVRKGERRKSRTVHSLIALTFLGPRPVDENGVLLDIAHYPNQDPADNRVANLMYATTRENMDQSTRLGGKHRSKKIPRTDVPTPRMKTSPKAEEILEMRRIWNLGGISFHRLARQFGYAVKTVRYWVIHE